MEGWRRGSGSAIEEGLVLEVGRIDGLGWLREGHWRVWCRAECSMTVQCGI